TIMRDVLIALVPAMIGAVVFFGLRALTVTLVSVAACMFWEWAYCKAMKLHNKTYDLSAVVTGVLLAFVCPVTIPYWTIILGDLFAIVLVKMLFGGLGRNIVNPALAGRAFMFSWPVLMSTWVKVGFENAAHPFKAVDVVTAATPLAAMHQGQMCEEPIWQLFVGNVGGCIGETSALLLLIGFIYLLVRRVISWHLPVVFIGTVFAVSFFLEGMNAVAALSAILSGGLLIGAIFMATDYVTSPATAWGKVLFGVGAGVITVLIRYYGVYPEGVSFAILLMNIVTPFIDSWTKHKVFGKGGKKA
ncbi:MAG: RnfABCDGE type electron transport complex subunit D, partial [Clostridia bacterium]|nr:RnfABCDGE type electron transport complex subunit D [Clostridia bacterium]